MRITIGSYIIDGTPASSTTTTAALRLDFERPFVPVVSSNEVRVNGLLAYVEAANEGALKTALDAVRAQFDQVSGKTVTYFNTTGTALYEISTTDWPEAEIEYEIDHSDVNAVISFNIVGRRPAPPTGGVADEPGQRGEIEWELEIGPNGLQGATATAEFGPSTGATAVQNASAWAAKMLTEPPTTAPAFFSTRLRAVTAVFRALEKPNQATVAYDSTFISVLFREAYSGLGAVPTLCTDWNVNSNMVNSEAMDVESGEPAGPAIIVLSGWFTLKTEAPTSFIAAATKVDRSGIYAKALTVYEAIEGDFRTVNGRHFLFEMGDPEISVGLDSGRVTFSRAFSTTRTLVYREGTTLQNIDPVMINRDYSGADTVHRGQGGPVVTLIHNLYVEALDVRAYIPPTLDANWERLDAALDVVITSQLRGGVLVHTTRGSSTWRYCNPGPRPTGTDNTLAGGRILTKSTLGNGTI